jgi:hypothetical protein
VIVRRKRAIASRIAQEALADWGAEGYEAIAATVGSTVRRTVEVEGRTWQVVREAWWDSAPRPELLAWVMVDDGGLLAYRPATAFCVLDDPDRARVRPNATEVTRWHVASKLFDESRIEPFLARRTTRWGFNGWETSPRAFALWIALLVGTMALFVTTGIWAGAVVVVFYWVASAILEIVRAYARWRIGGRFF